MYAETMSNGTIKTKPSTKKSDERELSRLRQKDYWLQVSRAKLIMDLIFVCESFLVEKSHAQKIDDFFFFLFSIRYLQVETRPRFNQGVYWPDIRHPEVSYSFDKSLSC
jgi:hypothetical protein